MENTERAVAQVAAGPPVVHLPAEIMERIISTGDLSKLSPEQRVAYYQKRCAMLGLDPAGRPFEYLVLKGKTVLYANAGCTQQLAQSRHLTSQIIAQKIESDLCIVQVRVTSADGRSSDNVGITVTGRLRGDDLANAMMKAVTKALRRATLAHEGLGMLDEEELDTMPEERTRVALQHYAEAQANPPNILQGPPPARPVPPPAPFFNPPPPRPENLSGPEAQPGDLSGWDQAPPPEREPGADDLDAAAWEGVCIPFGKKKGVLITDLDLPSLNWYAGYYAEKLTKDGASQYAGEWQRMKAALEALIVARQNNPA